MIPSNIFISRHKIRSFESRFSELTLGQHEVDKLKAIELPGFKRNLGELLFTL